MFFYQLNQTRGSILRQSLLAKQSNKPWPTFKNIYMYFSVLALFLKTYRCYHWVYEMQVRVLIRSCILPSPR